MKKLWAILLLSVLLVSCEGVDCTLNNMVLCHYSFYDSNSGDAISLSDTLTITAQGTDSVLFNQGVNKSSVSLPMSYGNDTDSLLFTITGDGYSYESTIFVSKTNIPHYESPDCPTTMFHQITDATCVSSVIDSVVVIRSSVNYLQDENIKVYIRTAD